MVQKRPSMGERILDDLVFWALVAAAIGFLYGVWASLEVLSHYVGPVMPFLPTGLPGR